MNRAELQFDFANAMAETVGPEHGVTRDDLRRVGPKLSSGHAALAELRESGEVAFYDLPYRKESVARVRKVAESVAGRFDAVVVLGIGGSALGNIALQASLNHPFYNLLDKKERNGFPRIFVMDNIDPEYFSGLLDVIDAKKTLFNLISKSGGTAEPMSQYMVIREILRRKLGKRARNHVIATTDREKGLLREVVGREKFESFVIPDNVGGRFSVFTPVGLLSAAMGGIDIGELLAGAAAMDARCRTSALRRNPAYLNAVIHYIADAKKGKPMSVMMAYSNALYLVADWYRQLWAESLGKKYDLKGRVVHTGQTPIKALGATDQHSQVQLYTEGPNDKIFTLVGVRKFRREVVIPKTYQRYDALAYLGGKTMNKLIDAERTGTAVALTAAGRPNLTVMLPAITPHTVGQMMYMYEVQTAFSGKLYGINAFDQPGVEAGKIAAFALMGRKGYAAKRKEILGGLKKSGRHIA